MAVTQNTYTGDGATVLFSFTFPYLETTDIKVSLNGTITTAYTLANATTIQFNTAPAMGVAIRIYRVTDDAALAAQFYPGSAIRSQDLNDNFTQNLYVTQESNRDATSAIATANAATATANSAVTTANAATATANTASSNASAAVATANTASSNASAAVSTANTASSNATTAVNTANAATATANSAASDAATALSTANSALSTANTASTNATNAVNTANSASSAASSAVSTANTASTTASNAVSTANSAVSTANSAVSTANSAVSTANSAVSTANAAASAVASAILYDIVANVAAIPGSPANNDAVEVTDSTGIESFTPLSGIPSGYVGDSGLSVRIVYTTTGSTWNWIQYFPNDPETRYGDAIATKLAVAGGTMTGALGVTAGSATAPSVFFTGDTNTGIYSPGADQVAISTNGVGRLFIASDGKIGVGTASPNTLIHASAAEAELKLVSTSGTNAAYLSFIPATQTLPLYIYADSSRNLIFQDYATERMRLDSSGRLGLGTSSPATRFDVISTASASTAISRFKSGTAAGDRGIEIASDANSNVLIQAIRGSDNATNYQLAINPNGGNVGIGTTSPTSALHIDVASGEPLRFRSRTSGSNYFTHVNHAGGDLAYVGAGGGAALGSGTTSDYAIRANQGALLFGTNGNNERARIDSSGRLLVGTSTALGPSTTSTGITLYPGDYSVMSAAGNEPLTLNRNNDGNILSCRRSGTHVGSISVTTTATAFNTSSDYRLKENVVPLTGAADRLNQLQVHRFNFIADPGKTVDGFIAHEAQAVVPECVTGEKDEVDDEGNPIYQGIDQSKLVPLLTAALQEALAEIESLKARVTALEP